MKGFLLGPKIFYGTDSLKYLESVTAQKACIVTDKFMVKLGIVDRISSILEESNIPHEVFDEVESDPTFDTVTKGLNHIITTKSDLLIAIGGGSAIDAAKAIMLFCMRLKEKVGTGGKIKKPWFVAIPTTSGTGSEVTSYSVITDTENNTKVPLTEELMIPDVAILDCELTKTVPPSVTADTGMDVLVHAVEAYVSKEAGDFTDIYAEKAIKYVAKYLLRVYKDGTDMEARGKMHIASCLAGVAFSNASLGITHSLAHAVGGEFHLPHGRCNAIFLPYVIKYNAGFYNSQMKNIAVAEKYSHISKSIGLPAADVKQGVFALIEFTKILLQKLDIPLTFAQTGIDRIKYEELIPKMTEHALNDYCTDGNPKSTTKEDLEKLLRAAYTGQE